MKRGDNVTHYSKGSTIGEISSIDEDTVGGPNWSWERWATVRFRDGSIERYPARMLQKSNAKPLVTIENGTKNRPFFSHSKEKLAEITKELGKEFPDYDFEVRNQYRETVGVFCTKLNQSNPEILDEIKNFFVDHWRVY